jgi:DNA-binding transcriptional MerR regulator
MRHYTLEELADESGYDKRVIRSFIEQGLLLGPAAKGRYARYGEDHLQRLFAIKHLRDVYGMPLAEVRRKLQSLSEAQIATIATEEHTRASGGKTAAAKPGSALEYLNQLKQSTRPAAPHTVPQAAPPFERLLLDLSNLVGNRKVAKTSRAETWSRISITPDLEFAVRDVQDDAELRALERIADHLREILLGGTEK